jgi:hypothetical protein
MGDDDGMRQVLEKTNVSSSMLREDRTRMVRPDVKVKRVVLWLCDFREGKMLMVKTLVGTNNIVLSLPTQTQFTGADNASGFTLLQELCRRYFQTEAVLKKWTFQHTYIYISTGTGIFIYSAKTSELPKETTNMVYVSMNAVYKVATATSSKESKNDGKEISIIDSDKPIIVEIFKVVKLISGGIISSTSKEYNDILARLGSKIVPPHLRSIISAAKRKKNIEANVNFLIKLFFSPNNLFLVGGNVPYYIFSSQRSCKISTMIKQPGYADDSYLTCLKLFLQTETDFKNKNKDSTNNFRVGCAVKKKLITDNFSAVWDNFWGDLIESEEESKLDDQLAEDVGKDVGEGEDIKGEKSESDSSICLELARQSGDTMYYGVSQELNYLPIKYNDVYYNIHANEKYRFNNEFFYDLGNQLTPYTRDASNPNDAYLGFSCIAYYKNGNNPILFLGDKGSVLATPRMGRVYKLELKTHKLTKFIEVHNVGGGGGGADVFCMDILDAAEGGYILVGGNFNRMTTYDDAANVVEQQTDVTICAAMVNLKTYKVIKLFNDTPAFTPNIVHGGHAVNKVCICKNKKVVKAKGVTAQSVTVEGYVALIGGDFNFDIINDNDTFPPSPPPPPGARTRERITNIGCVLIKKNPNPNNPNNLDNMEARLVAVDSKVALEAGGVIRSGITHSVAENFDLTSIICPENEDNYKSDKADKSETVFFIGGRFDRFYAIDYVAYNTAKAAGPAPGRPVPAERACNGIIKLKLKSEYDDVDTISKYNQTSEIEPIVVARNNNPIIQASLQYGIINSKKYLFCLTGFTDAAPPANVDTMLNVYDIGSKSNILQMPMPPQNPPILLDNYAKQTLLLTKDNDQSVLIMSFTRNNAPGPHFKMNYTYTCNVSELNKDAAAPQIVVIAAASNENDNIDKNNFIMDMFYHKDTGEVFIAHMFPYKSSITEYPLTVRSNYQQIGEWKLESTLKKDATGATGAADASELNIFDKFIDKVIEMRKIFKFHPSMILFLQDVDFRDYNHGTSKVSKVTKTRLDEMNTGLLDAMITLHLTPPPAPPPAPLLVWKPVLIAAGEEAAKQVASGAPDIALVQEAAAQAAQAVGIALIAADATRLAQEAVAGARAAAAATGGREAYNAIEVVRAAAASKRVLLIAGLAKAAVQAGAIAAIINQKQINLGSPCNDIDKKIKNIMDVIYALRTPFENLFGPIAPVGRDAENIMTFIIGEKIYKFINDLLFMLEYTKCNSLAEIICNNYVNFVMKPVAAEEPPAVGVGLPVSVSIQTRWKQQFEDFINTTGGIKALIDNIGKKAVMYKGKSKITPDTPYNFKICSDPITHTGISYLEYNYNKNTNSSFISLTNQNNIKNRIYESDNDGFFSSSNGEQFHMNHIINDIGNGMEQIKFCSFYKLKRLTMPNDPFGNIGNDDSYTVYVSVDINGDGIKSGQVFDFLSIIREYFMSLTGVPDVDIRIGGPIKRLTFCGNFGCNLLNDVEVCRKFKSKQMKIYTMKKNMDSKPNQQNQIFMIDVDLEPAAQAGGGNGDYNSHNNHNNQKRICIGERIEEDKRRVLVNKRKTRRKVPLMLSSS